MRKRRKCGRNEEEVEEKVHVKRNVLWCDDDDV